jgi:hypothetical protein
MPGIHDHRPIPNSEAAVRIAEEAVQRLWDISAQQRAIVVQRIVQVAESDDPLLAIKAAWIFLAMDEGNRAAAKLLAQLDEQYGLPVDAALEALARRLDAPEHPAERALAS